MARITHLINGQDLGVPRNWAGLEILIDWINKKDSGEINVTDLEFVDEANQYFQQRILNGLSGGPGIFEGDKYEILVGDPLNPTYRFEGFLDFTNEMTVLGGEEIVVGLKKQKGEDWLNDVADSFSFAYLYNQGVITNGDFVRVPYVINYVPDGLELSFLALSIYMMTKETIENVQKLAETIADVTDASTPVVGVSVGLGAGVVTAWDLGNFILVVLKALARLAYIIAITIAIINLIEELFEQLLPKKRFHLGMTFKRLFEKGCQHLGMNFSSDIPELSWVHIPSKNKRGGESGETGFPSNTGPIYTFGDLIRVTKEMFNADFRIENNTFIFRRRDGFQVPSTYQIPNFFNDQDRLLDVNGFNTDELVANYNIAWSLDLQDQNTLDVVDGRVFQAITTPVSTTNPDFVQIKGLTQIGIPFSIGLDKKKLTDVEKVLKSLGSVVDAITGIFGGGTNFESKIEQRVGSLLLSSHFLTTGKVVVMAGSKLAQNQRSLVDARKLWNKYHFINSFAEINGQHNQWYLFKNQRVPMTIQEFDQLLTNNFATDDQGNEYLIEIVRYIPEDDTATIDFRVKKKYTNNLKIDFI
jgi:hypothetical protein